MNYKYIYPLLDLDGVECPFALHGNNGTTCKHTDEECILNKVDYCEDMCNDYINCRIINDNFLVKLMEMYNDVNEKLNDIHEKLKKMEEGKRACDFDIEIYRAASRKNTLREILVYYFKHN